MSGLDELETVSSKSDSSLSDAEDENRSITPQNVYLQPVIRLEGNLALNSNSEDDEIGDGLRTFHHQVYKTQPNSGQDEHVEGALKTESVTSGAHPKGSAPTQPFSSPTKVVTAGSASVSVERRRRKLPEIPKNKKRE